jgi:hypothetical protein
MRRDLQWFDEGDGRWIARASCSCGGQITVREFEMAASSTCSD